MASAAALALVPASVSAQNWQLVWQDEFNGSIGPDWSFETGTGGSGWGNNELQYYLPQNATIENNALVITAKNESAGDLGPLSLEPERSKGRAGLGRALS